MRQITLRNLSRLIENYGGAKKIRNHSPSPIVSFAFDGFPKSTWTNVKHVFEQHGVGGTYYFCGSLCGQTIDGIKYFDSDDLIEISHAGHEIGCHTYNYTRLIGKSGADINREFNLNAAFLKEILPGQMISTMAYPFGELSFMSKRVSSQNFAACRSIIHGINKAWIDLGSLRCVRLDKTSLDKKSLDSWILETKESNGWTIFLAHEAQPNPSPVSLTSTFINQTLEKVIDAGIKILPIKNALGQLAHPAR